MEVFELVRRGEPARGGWGLTTSGGFDALELVHVDAGADDEPVGRRAGEYWLPNWVTVIVPVLVICPPSDEPVCADAKYTASVTADREDITAAVMSRGSPNATARAARLGHWRARCHGRRRSLAAPAFRVGRLARSAATRGCGTRRNEKPLATSA